VHGDDRRDQQHLELVEVRNPPRGLVQDERRGALACPALATRRFDGRPHLVSFTGRLDFDPRSGGVPPQPEMTDTAPVELVNR
jgi:hypothetical protein